MRRPGVGHLHGPFAASVRAHQPVHGPQCGDGGVDVLLADAGQHAAQVFVELMDVQFADLLGGTGQAQCHRTAVGFGLVLDHQALADQFVDEFRDARRGHSQEGSDAADACRRCRRSALVVDAPDGVDDVDVPRLHVLRQFRQRFGDAFRQPACLDQVVHVVQRKFLPGVLRLRHTASHISLPIVITKGKYMSALDKMAAAPRAALDITSQLRNCKRYHAAPMMSRKRYSNGIRATTQP